MAFAGIAIFCRTGVAGMACHAAVAIFVPATWMAMFCRTWVTAMAILVTATRMAVLGCTWVTAMIAFFAMLTFFAVVTFAAFATFAAFTLNDHRIVHVSPGNSRWECGTNCHHTGQGNQANSLCSFIHDALLLY